jgi:hypothetical protein
LSNLDLLFTGKIRLKLLMRLFLNPEVMVHLRGLANDFEVSTNTVRQELNLFKELDLIQEVDKKLTEKPDKKGKTGPKNYQANQSHPVFSGLQLMIRQHLGIDALVEKMIDQIGRPEAVYLTGPLAEGRDTPIIDLIIVADGLNENSLQKYINKAEGLVGKKIRAAVYGMLEWEKEEQEVRSMKLLRLI